MLKLSPSIRSASLTLAALGLGVSVLSACGADSQATTADTRVSTKPLAATVPSGVKIVVADDADKAATLMRLSGEQDKLAESVSYANFSSGPLRLEAIRAGRADIGLVGDVPPILAQYSDAPVRITSVFMQGTDGTKAATSPGSGVTSYADLKGKTVGVSEGTAQQAIFLRNLAAAGLSIKDVKAVNVTTDDISDALRTGNVTAGVIKNPDRARYLAQNPTATELPNDKSTATVPFYSYSSVSSLNDPAKAAALRDFIIHYYRALQWKQSHKSTWVSDYFVKDQNLDQKDAVEAANEDNVLGFPGFTSKVIDFQQNTIDLLQKSGEFADKPLKAEDEYDMRFATLKPTDPTASDK